MAKTIDEGVTRVRSFLDEPTTANWTDEEIMAFLNQYYQRTRAKVIAVFEDYYLTTSTFASIADRQEYTSSDGVPTNIHKIRRVEVNYDTSVTGNAPLRAFPIIDIDNIQRDLGFATRRTGVQVFSNANYYSFGFGTNLTIGIVPKPHRSDSNAIKVWYVPTTADLTTGQYFDLPNPDLYYLIPVYGAVAECLRFGQQASTDAQQFEIKYTSAIQEMQQDLEDRTADGSRTVMDVSQDYV